MYNRGELEKLTILSYENPDYSDQDFKRFEAYVNPSEITIAYEVEYDSTQGSGTTNSRMHFKKAKPGDLSLVLFLDGTGVNDQKQKTKIDVQQKVNEFQEVTGYNGNIHRTSYLKVMWGTLTIKRCVLKSASIAYKLFQPSGIPLRAVITANFTDNSDDKTRQAIAQDQSPDLTHVRLIKAGDTLPALCNQIYNDPNYYLEVAQANKIDNFRQLVPGSKVFFPPLEK
jgi:Contractile injection system tube protein